MKKIFASLFISLFLAIPCFSEDFTLGMVQQRLHEGMSQSEIVCCLGTPNLITKNTEGCETWVYDKKSQSTTETCCRKWYWLLLKGKRKGCNSTETSQKALTVTLNFNKNSCLESYSYNSSSY